MLRDDEVREDYEADTAAVIIERLAGIDPLSVPAVLVAGHGPFTWGRSPHEAVEHSIVLEYVAEAALQTMILSPQIDPIPRALLDKHFLRKHGPGAYYGQDR